MLTLAWKGWTEGLCPHLVQGKGTGLLFESSSPLHPDLPLEPRKTPVFDISLLPPCPCFAGLF